jgi:hypothetical protein
MEDVHSAQRESQGTGELLSVVIEELRNIGLILARQNDRIEALSKAKDGVRFQDSDSVSLAVGLDCPKPFVSTDVFP